MIDPNSLFLDLQSAVNTSLNGWFRPETDFIRSVNEVSLNLWKKWTNEAEKSQEAKDKLFPFLKSKNIAVDSTGGYYGIAKKPTSYGRFASARVIVHSTGTIPAKDVDDGKCEGFEDQEQITDEYYDNIKEFKVEMVDNQRWSAYLEHLTKGPTIEKPGITQINDYFRVAPRKVSVVVIDYYVEPKPATFKYTLTPGNVQTGSGDMIIYDAANSQKLEWPEQVRPEFLEELKSWYIQFARDQNFSVISAQQKGVQLSNK
jgi:hypothetical protein